jgi:hypothetical protein
MNNLSLNILTSFKIPSDVWMCPNHVESLLDSKLTSNRLTERIHLWEKFATQPIDTHIVKTQFMKKCSRLKRTCSMKATTVASKKRVKVIYFSFHIFSTKQNSF